MRGAVWCDILCCAVLQSIAWITEEVHSKAPETWAGKLGLFHVCSRVSLLI